MSIRVTVRQFPDVRRELTGAHLAHLQTEVAQRAAKVVFDITCGGIPGFYKLLRARADPEDPDHAEATEYLDHYDPDLIDDLPIKYALGRIASRRNAAKARINNKP